MTSQCTSLTASASDSVLSALRAVDCLSNETAAIAFGRLFGSNGVLLPALTILLTLYIAFFAIALLTGRSSIGLAALTPRAITLGLVLTFSTSWVAYQTVVWSLATGAPDQLATIIMGSKGSATEVFANRIDLVLRFVSDVSDLTAGGAQGAASAAASGSFTPVNLMWLGTLLLMLGTVGVLVTVRIALAVLLALGPIFIVFALFPSTKGLCAGWLRGLVLTAVTPLFVVVGGGLMLELLIPILDRLADADGINGRAALALFMVAAIHVALMIMSLRVAASVVSAWNVFGLAPAASAGPATDAGAVAPAVPLSVYDRVAPAMSVDSRAVLIAAGQGEDRLSAAPVPQSATAPGRVVFSTSTDGLTQAAVPVSRAQGIGSQFRARPTQSKEFIR